ncbi:MAG: hypothetical protein ACRDV3_02265 [Acidothermaceae bacterium]
MSEPRIPNDPAATEEVPEADAQEQQTEVLDLTDAAGEVDDDERVVAVDEEEYR